MDRKHINVRGRVPTISEAARLAKLVGFQPRIKMAAVADAANVVFETSTRVRKDALHQALTDTGWAFVHDKSPRIKGRVEGTDIFTVLVSL
jgi:hypothetical protein